MHINEKNEFLHQVNEKGIQPPLVLIGETMNPPINIALQDVPLHNMNNTTVTITMLEMEELLPYSSLIDNYSIPSSSSSPSIRPTTLNLLSQMLYSQHVKLQSCQ